MCTCAAASAVGRFSKRKVVVSIQQSTRERSRCRRLRTHRFWGIRCFSLWTFSSTLRVIPSTAVCVACVEAHLHRPADASPGALDPPAAAEGKCDDAASWTARFLLIATTPLSLLPTNLVANRHAVLHSISLPPLTWSGAAGLPTLVCVSVKSCRGRQETQLQQSRLACLHTGKRHKGAP